MRFLWYIAKFALILAVLIAVMNQAWIAFGIIVVIAIGFGLFAEWVRNRPDRREYDS